MAFTRGNERSTQEEIPSDRGSESSVSSLDITDECLNDIQDRLNRADISEEDDVRVCVYLQPGAPEYYSSDELTVLIASLESVSKSVHLYISESSQNLSEQYLSFLQQFQLNGATTEIKVLRESSYWQSYWARVQSSGQLKNQTDQEVLTDILSICHLDSSVAQQSTAKSVYNIILLDRSVPDAVDGILVQGIEGCRSAVLGKYKNVVELQQSLPIVSPDKTPTASPQKTLSGSPLRALTEKVTLGTSKMPPVQGVVVNTANEVDFANSSSEDFIDHAEFLKTFSAMYAGNPPGAMKFLDHFSTFAEEERRRSAGLHAVSPFMTPPHTHNAFTQTEHGTPNLGRPANKTDDDDEQVASPPVSTLGLFGVPVRRAGSLPAGGIVLSTKQVDRGDESTRRGYYSGAADR